MAESETSELYDFLEKYDIRTLTGVSTDVICSICGRVMINPCYGPCSCQYCSKCIRDNLENKADKMCPGNTKRCNLVELDLNKNINIDERIGLKISMLEIKCPTESCTFEDCVSAVIEHHRVCIGMFDRCPYFSLGCESQPMKHEDVASHFVSDTSKHAEIMMGFVINMKSQLDNLYSRDSENRSVKSQENLMEQLGKRIENQEVILQGLKENISNLSRTHQDLRSSIEFQGGEIDQLKISEESFQRIHQTNILNVKQKGSATTMESSPVKLVTTKEFEEFTKEFQNQIKNQNKLMKDLTTAQKKNVDRLEEKMKFQESCMMGCALEKDKMIEALEIIDDDIDDQKGDIDIMKMRLEKFRKELTPLTTEAQNLKETFEKYCSSNPLGKKKIRSIETEISKLQENSTEIKSLKEKIGLVDISQNQFLQQIQDNQDKLKKIEDIELQQIECQRKIGELQKLLINFDDSVSDTSECRSSQIRSPLMEQYLSQFIWKIENLTEKRRNAQQGIHTDIISNSFYSHDNGYKICLCFAPNSKGTFIGTHGFLGFSFMKGEFDQYLEWPCRFRIQISIIRHDNEEEYLTRFYEYETTLEKYRYRYRRPVNYFNGSVGHPSFINWDHVKLNNSIYQDDSILVRCRIYSPT